MLSDDRSLHSLKLDLSVEGIVSEEPFVTYADFNENTVFADYYSINRLNKYCFCVSDRLKEILEVYQENFKPVPFFITDKKLQRQIVYWKFGTELQDCLEIRPKMKYDNLTVIKDKIKGRYMFKVGFDKQEYIIVSLHLAENILRKNMNGIKFIPVNLK